MKKQWNTRMRKQQLFNNHTTFVQQRKTMKNDNETPIKHNNEEQHWNTAMTNKKLQRKQQWNIKVKKQQSYNNHTTIVQQWKTYGTHELNTTINKNEKQHINTAITLSNEKQ